MQLPNHFIASWCLGAPAFATKRERFYCIVAGMIPDLDGIGIIFDVKYYHEYHHVVGHNVWVAVIVGSLCALRCRNGCYGMAIYTAIFLFHLLLDYFGSGGWGMYLFWPTSSRYFESSYVWGLDSWQNGVVLGGFLVWMLVLISRLGETPLAYIAPRLDRKLADAWRRFESR